VGAGIYFHIACIWNFIGNLFCLARRRAGVLRADHVLLGTDYPHDISHRDPVRFVEAIDELTDEEKIAITGGNAKKLFKLGALEAVAAE